MLVAYIEVAESLSVSNSAHTLDVGKGLISKRIAQLEEKLKATLFSRSTRKIALTPAGEAYLEFARRAVREIADGMEQVRSLESDLTGTLRITAPVSWGQKVLAKHLPEFLRLHPALAIELKLTDRIMDLANERIDVALRWSKAPTQEISSTHMTTVRWLLVAAPEYLSQNGIPVMPSELSSHSCLYYRRDSSDDTWTLQGSPSEAVLDSVSLMVKASNRYAVDNPDAVFEAAFAGLGIALLPDYLCETAIEQGNLVKLLPAWEPVTKFGTGIAALSTPERLKLARSKAFISFLKRTLAKR